MTAIFVLLGIASLIIFLVVIEKIIVNAVDNSETNYLVKKILENQENNKTKKEE